MSCNIVRDACFPSQCKMQDPFEDKLDFPNSELAWFFSKRKHNHLAMFVYK